MGPRPNGRGKRRLPSRLLGCYPLQWGRGQTAAERSLAFQIQIFNDSSMGPRPNGRGKTAGVVAGLQVRLSSMGPRPNGRGKSGLVDMQDDLTGSSMGPRPNGRGKRIEMLPQWARCLLQWGRGQTAAESFWHRAPPLRALAFFNGAAAKRPRKACGKMSCKSRPCSSMGPRPNGRGKATRHTRQTRGATSSMGPRPNGRGKGAAPLFPSMPLGSSMGPRPNGRGKRVRFSPIP